MMKMSSDRKCAIAVGLLYVVATVAGLAAMAVGGTSLFDGDVLANFAAHGSQVVAVASLDFVMAVAVAGVAFMMYPILMQDADTESKRGLALWYVGTRITEGAVFLIAILGLLSLWALAEELVNAGGPAASQFQAAAAVVSQASDYAWMLGQSVFCVGAVMLYYLLYLSRRVPRWLSIWGLLGAPLMFAAGASLLATGDANSTVATVLYAPLAVQEMVFALWLLAKGFNPTAIGSGPAPSRDRSLPPTPQT
jgi:hypothetical protein